jgi:hypothetical protein
MTGSVGLRKTLHLARSLKHYYSGNTIIRVNVLVTKKLLNKLHTLTTLDHTALYHI